MTDALIRALQTPSHTTPKAVRRLRAIVGIRDDTETEPVLRSVATVARMLDCSPWTVRRRIRDGEPRPSRTTDA